MEKKDRESYVFDNHESETAAEMADSLGIEESKIRSILIKLGLKAVKPSDKRKGIMPPPEPKKLSWSESIREAEKIEYKKSLEPDPPKGKIIRAPGVYNQNGSPYGIATELLGIKIKR